MPAPTRPLKTREHALQIADELGTLLVKLNTLEAEETAELNTIKKRFGKRIKEARKKRDTIKRRLTTWIMKNAKLLFGSETGTVKSSLCEISLRKNPDSIKPIDTKADEADLVKQARALGMDHVIKVQESISIDALSALSDQELEQLGFQRVASKTASYTLLINRKQSERRKVA